MTSSSGAETPLPGAHEVHLWAAETAGQSEAPECLSDEERERAEAFHFDRDRARYRGRTRWLRRVLATYLGQRPEELVFARGEHGKPRLVRSSGPDLRFNASHSAGRALLAVAVGREVGVDLEATGRGQDLEGMARRVFDAREREQLAQLGGADERRAAFFRGWTRKEALLKALGHGFLQEPDRFHVGLGPSVIDEPRALEDAAWADFGAWVDLPAPAGFAAALVVEGLGWRPVWV